MALLGSCCWAVGYAAACAAESKSDSDGFRELAAGLGTWVEMNFRTITSTGSSRNVSASHACFEVPKNLFLFAQSLLDEPNPNSPANSQAAQLYQENKREYEKRVSAIVEQSWRDC